MYRSIHRPWPSLTVIIIGINVAIFVIQSILLMLPDSTLANWFYNNLPLRPYLLIKGAIWQLFTFPFLHGGVFHLFINCLVLFLIGRHVELLISQRAYLLFYLGAGAIGGIVQSAFMLAFPEHFGTGPVVGASAGVSGLVALFAMLNKEAFLQVLLAFIIPIRMRAITLLYILLGIALLGMLQPHSGVAHAAHLGGLLTGICYAVYLKRVPVEECDSVDKMPKIQIVKVKLQQIASYNYMKGKVRGQDEDLPPDEFIEKEVDPILDKIREQGINSLTERERQILERACRKIRER